MVTTRPPAGALVDPLLGVVEVFVAAVLDVVVLSLRIDSAGTARSRSPMPFDDVDFVSPWPNTHAPSAIAASAPAPARLPRNEVLGLGVMEDDRGGRLLGLVLEA